MEAINNTSAVAQDHGNYQLESNDDCPLAEDSNYLSEQLITYIGNKRTLLGQNRASGYVTSRNGPVRSISVSSMHLAVLVSFRAF